MTQAKTDALVVAERDLFRTPRVPGEPSRAAKIAAIYAFAHWLLEHPEVPAPTRIDATWWTRPVDEADEATRIAGMAAVAGQLGEQVLGEPTGILLFNHEVASEGQHGVDISYSGAVVTDAWERARAAERNF